VQISLVLSGLCGDKHQAAVAVKWGASAVLTNEACAIAERLRLVAEDMVDVAALCVAPGRAVFVLACDLMCLDDDGNVMDACLLALIGALKHLRLPSMLVLEDQVARHPDAPSHAGLALRIDPVPLTCGVFEGSLLVDPSADEESVMDGSVTVIVDARSGDCAVCKPGGPPLPMDAVQSLLAACKTRVIITA